MIPIYVHRRPGLVSLMRCHATRVLLWEKKKEKKKPPETITLDHHNLMNRFRISCSVLVPFHEALNPSHERQGHNDEEPHGTKPGKLGLRAGSRSSRGV